MKNKGEFLHRLEASTGLLEHDAAEAITASVLRTLASRLTPTEASHVEAQLPEDLKPLWHGNLLEQALNSFQGQTDVNLDEFVDRVAKDANVSRARALQLTQAVFHLLKEQISEGKSWDIGAQLPKALKMVWLEA